jgi:dolichol-phosphate mannosyltransferase
MRLSVVVPARNEVDNIATCIESIRGALSAEAIPYDIVIVDDGSSDGTADIVRSFAAADPGVRLVSNGPPHGFGRAVRAGLDAFTGDAVVIMMADGSDSTDDLLKYYVILRDEADCAFGSRFVRGGRVIKYPIIKLILNRISNIFIAMLFGIQYDDVTNAFKGYRAFVIDACRPLVSPHFNMTVEIPLKAMTRGFTYKVVPIVWTNRTAGESSFRIKEMGSRYIHVVLAVWLELLLSHGDFAYPRKRVLEARQEWRAAFGLGGSE